MTYESTGEVRVPRKGEQFLMFHPEDKVTHKIHPPLRSDDEFMGDSPRVIMRPVEEPSKDKYKSWAVVIPFVSERSAIKAQRHIESLLCYTTAVQEVEVHE
jgi:hypothetical protein